MHGFLLFARGFVRQLSDDVEWKVMAFVVLNGGDAWDLTRLVSRYLSLCRSVVLGQHVKVVNACGHFIVKVFSLKA